MPRELVAHRGISPKRLLLCAGGLADLIQPRLLFHELRRDIKKLVPQPFDLLLQLIDGNACPSFQFVMKLSPFPCGVRVTW